MQIKSPYYRVSVKAKINFNGKILLVKEDGKKWDLPGGGVEHFETIQEALTRELTEEIGVSESSIISGPKIFKMIDAAVNRPLIFIVYELELESTTEFHPSDNVEIGLFDSEKIQDTVSYSPEYTDYIRE
jgi:hydrolase, NUDIX family